MPLNSLDQLQLALRRSSNPIGETQSISQTCWRVSIEKHRWEYHQLKAGGGMNLNLKPHLALRLFEADYLRTQLPNSTNNAQNNLQLGAGLVLRFR